MHVIIHELGAVVDGHKLLQFHCEHLEARLMHGDAATKRVLPLEVVLVTRPVLVSRSLPPRANLSLVIRKALSVLQATFKLGR